MRLQKFLHVVPDPMRLPCKPPPPRYNRLPPMVACQRE